MPRPYNTAVFANFYGPGDSGFIRPLRRRGYVVVGYPQFLAPMELRHQGLISWPPNGDLFCADCQSFTLLYFILLNSVLYFLYFILLNYISYIPRLLSYILYFSGFSQGVVYIL